MRREMLGRRASYLPRLVAHSTFIGVRAIKKTMNDVHPEIAQALEAFRSHNPVAIPTETVYGLAAPISDLKAISAIFQLKERPLFNPLIVHVNSVKMAKSYVRTWPHLCDLLASYFWPGPLTMILPKSHLVSDLITAGHGTVGLRIPDHPFGP